MADETSQAVKVLPSATGGRSLVVVDESDGNYAGLLYLAHVEAGYQVTYDGDVMATPWWKRFSRQIARAEKERDRG